ncbi:MAG: GntR family transcriptional regulator, partial [Solirubrobacteraceae bacterium]
MSVAAETLNSPKKLDRASPQALHEQLSERVRALIDDAGHGGRLPTEDALVRMFDVSRATVRRAVDTLVDEGTLVRRQGRGTFVTRAHEVSPLDRLRPFVDAFDGDEGVQTRVVAFAWVSGPEVPQAFGGPDAEALMFERLYLSEEAPHALVRVMVPEDLGRGITRAQIEHHPIYHVLRDELGQTLREADVAVRCEPAGGAVARSLGVVEGSSLLVLERATLDQDGRIIEVAKHFLLPEQYQL